MDFFDEFMPQVNVLARFAYTRSVQFFPAGYGTFFEMIEQLPSNPVMEELQVGRVAERVAESLETYAPDAVISVAPVAGGVVSAATAALDGLGDGHHRLTGRTALAPPVHRPVLRCLHGGPRGTRGQGHGLGPHGGVGRTRGREVQQPVDRRRPRARSSTLPIASLRC